jgi:urease accessory protein
VTTPSPLLAALQLGDSALPIGRFVHSHGLEAWLRDRGDVTSETVAELVATTITEAVAPLDCVVLAHAYSASTLGQLSTLDEHLTVRKLTPAARKASLACGRQLAVLSSALVPDDELMASFIREVQSRHTDGNLAVIEGSLARACKLSKRDAVLIELRGSASALLSAAVRLGAISPRRAQEVMAQLAPALTRAAESALAMRLDEVSSTAPELEICALAHARADARLFAT